MRTLTSILALSILAVSTYANAEGNSSEPSTSSIPKKVKETEPSNYKTLEPLVIPVIKSGKVYGYLRIEVQLATKDGSPIDGIKQLYPILQDRYFTNLYSVLCDRWLPDTPLEQDVILDLIRKMTTAVQLERIKEDNLTAYLKSFYFTPANKD